MKKLLYTIAACLLAANLSFAQDATPQPDPKVLPMFGKVVKTEAQQLQDEKFLSSCDKSFTTRTEASNFFMERGWEYLNEGQTDTAMYRFNLAWLLNPDNADAHWAFGLVTVAKGTPTEAVGYYEKALALKPKNSLLLSDLATCYVAMYEQKPKSKSLKKAATYLDQSIAADAQNAYAYFTMSKIKYFNKDYNGAWTYLHKGRELNMAAVDYNYLLQLTEKMKDPQGFYKSDETAAQPE